MPRLPVSLYIPLVALLPSLMPGCGVDSPDDGKCYQETPQGRVEVACPDDGPAHAEALCGSGGGDAGVTPGGESTTPAAACTWATPTARAPVAVQYGTTAAQTCDCYAPVSPSGDTDAMIVSSGFTGGSRAAAQWVLWARHRADLGHTACVCDVRHSAAGGINPFPAPPDDARCVYRTLAATSATGHVKAFGASAGAALADYADATANRQIVTVGAASVTLDDATCPLAWSSSDAAIVTRVTLWSEPGDLRVKAKINPGTQTNMDAYLAVTGESDPLWASRSALSSPVLVYRTGMAPRLALASTGDFVVYPEHTAGSLSPLLSPGCTSVHPTGLTGIVPAVRAVGVNATNILNACPSSQHLPTFAPPTIGDCTADLF